MNRRDHLHQVRDRNEEFEKEFFEYLDEKYDMEAMLEELNDDEVQEMIEYELSEAERLFKDTYRGKSQRASISRPKFDEKGNVILTKKAEKKKEVVKPSSRKIGKSALTKKTKFSRYDEAELKDKNND